MIRDKREKVIKYEKKDYIIDTSLKMKRALIPAVQEKVERFALIERVSKLVGVIVRLYSMTSIETKAYNRRIKDILIVINDLEYILRAKHILISQRELCY